jgi:hypothetical protein
MESKRVPLRGGTYSPRDIFLFDFLAGAGRVRLPAYPLALPLVGILIGTLELITGVPIRRLDEGWQKLTGYVKAPVAIVGSLGFLVGLVKLLGF